MRGMVLVPAPTPKSTPKYLPSQIFDKTKIKYENPLLPEDVNNFIKSVLVIMVMYAMICSRDIQHLLQSIMTSVGVFY
jgi:hypothetical protein